MQYCVSITITFFTLWALFLTPATTSADNQSTANPQADTTTIEVLDEVKVAQVKRIGINIGQHDRFGAAQYFKNLIVNPGLEAGEFATIFHVRQGGHATRTTFEVDNWNARWANDGWSIGQPEGFWDGAEYEFITGSAKHRSGTIRKFTHMEDEILPEQLSYYAFETNDDGRVPGDGDTVIMRTTTNVFRPQPLAGDNHVYSFIEPDTTTTRPNSPGEQSLKLRPANDSWTASFRYYMDSYGRHQNSNAGKLITIKGNWSFELWAKAETDGEQLDVFFHRQTEATFFYETLTLSTEWEKYTIDFSVTSNADTLLKKVVNRARYQLTAPYPNSLVDKTIMGNNLLEVGVRIPQTADSVWIDDIQLLRTDQTNPTIFTDTYVNRLKELQPGILRNWGAQLGSSLDNQLVRPLSRKMTGYDPDDRWATQYHYSLHEFLELAQEVDAEPWYVIPPTFTADEINNLVAYLAAPAGEHPYADWRESLGQTTPWTDVFDTIHLELGNEMWGGNDGGDQFRGGTMRGGVRLAQYSHDRFTTLKNNTYYSNAFNLIIGGQSNAPERQQEIEDNSNTHDTIAVAPYFGTLDHYETDGEIFGPLFARPRQDVTTGNLAQTRTNLANANQNTNIAIYELSYHTNQTDTDVPIDIRNKYVSGASGAIALPLHMLTYQSTYGIRNQAAFTALQHSLPLHKNVSAEEQEYVNLWGLLRDLEATGRKRPAWLGIELANSAIRGDMLRTTHRDTPSWTQSAINEIEAPLDVPIIQSFAFRENDKYALVLFNLHIRQAQNVTLRFPYPVHTNAQLRQIVPNDIYDTNETAKNVVIDHININDLQQNYQMTLEPHSMYVLEWEHSADFIYMPILAHIN